MANNKDFLVNGPVSVGKDTKVTVGSITASDIDLSTGNYFADTLAANTTYTLSNAGAVQAFQLEVTGGVSLSGSSPNGSYNVSAQDTIPSSVFIGNSGTKMYVWGQAGDDVDQYTLSTAWDVSTASYDSKQLAVSEGTQGYSMYFRSDGLKFFWVDSSSDSVYQYTLSTAWDISTASYDSKSFSGATQDTIMRGVWFKTDGTKMYLTGLSNDSIYQYTLSTAWDVSTASYDSVSLDLSASLTSPTSPSFNAAGTKFVIHNGGILYEYSLSTAWDISTASATGASYDTTSTITTSFSSFSSIDDGFSYVVGTDDIIYRFDYGSADITWPSSIEWAGGVAPSAPANGETDVFTFVTDDSGTTYTGVKSIDNAS
jgi:hypothetical protein